MSSDLSRRGSPTKPTADMEQFLRKRYVIKRDGRKEPVNYEKIAARLLKLCYNLDSDHVELGDILEKVVLGTHEGVKTRDLDNLAAETCANMVTRHPDYGVLATRIEVSNLHKETKSKFSDVVEQLHKAKAGPVVTKEFYDDVMAIKDYLDEAIKSERDYDLTYFGVKTLQRSYLYRVDGEIVERPQHMFMRVAVELHGRDHKACIETYEAMSQRKFIHASPTLFNAGAARKGLASCYLLGMDDSLNSIFDTFKECGIISSLSGGIGIHIHDIRANGAKIKSSSNGRSNGIVPMLRMYNELALYVDQGGKRPGSVAIYLEPSHPDVMDFLDLKLPHGHEKMRARDLFLAMWITDLFMERVEKNEKWSLFCPSEAPGLSDVYGEEYRKLYEQYEREGRASKVIQAQDLWRAIVNSQVETGVPYITYKDAINSKSNQKHIGTIKSSNLCSEIAILSDKDEIGVCILASVGLPAFVKQQGSDISFDYHSLYETTKIVARNLNKVIDRTHYPVEKAKRGNLRHRPIGIGVSGLADTFCKLRIPFESQDAKKLNREIFETIYYAALEASCELAERDGPYPSYEGSEFSKGILQFDMWDPKSVKLSDRWDWAKLREKISKHGLRNSLLTAVMPTATTSQILGYSECIEPYNSNVYLRKTQAGEFQIVNPYLLRELCDLGIWNNDMKNRIILDDGSVQNIPEIPTHVKELYKTVWEVKQRCIIDMSADRGPFVDQTQSLNIFMRDPDYAKLTSMHFYGWKKGLKTGMYYLRMQPAASALKTNIDMSSTKEPTPASTSTSTPKVCTLRDRELGCDSCAA